MEPQRGGRPLVRGVVARVADQILHDDGLAPLDHEAAQALADVQPGARHEGRRRFGPRPEDELVALDQPEPRGLDAEQAGGLVDDEGQHLVGLVDGGETAADLVEDLEPPHLGRLLPRAAEGAWCRACHVPPCRDHTPAGVRL